MYKADRILTVSVVVIVFSLLVQNGWADDLKERMKQRLPTLVEMKLQGVIGENASGYIEYVSGAITDTTIVDDENRDRKTVYSAIAGQQGVSVEKVEKLRALQIVDKAKSGEYLKNEGGTWYRK